jgi:shikimate 5-dehydrogenase
MEISVSPHIRGKYAYAASGQCGGGMTRLATRLFRIAENVYERNRRENIHIVDRNGEKMKKLKRTINKWKDKINKVLKEQSREMFQVIFKCTLKDLGQEINR